MKNSKKVISLIVGTMVIGGSSLTFAGDPTPPVIETNCNVSIIEAEWCGEGYQIINEENPKEESEVEIKKEVININSSEWSKEHITKAISRNLFNKTIINANSDFKKDISREEFAEVVMGYIKAEISTDQIDTILEEMMFPEIIKYSDTVNPLLIQLSELQIIKGVDDKDAKERRFLPKKDISREEIAVIISRAEQLIMTTNFPKAPHSIDVSGNLKAFTDRGIISEWAQSEVAHLVQDKLINGMGDGTFNPKGKATREQAIKILIEALEQDRSKMSEGRINGWDKEIENNKDLETFMEKREKELGDKFDYMTEYYSYIKKTEGSNEVTEAIDMTKAIEIIKEAMETDKELEKHLREVEKEFGIDFDPIKEFKAYNLNK